MNINELIKKMILQTKTTQKELSKSIGVSTSTLNNWLKLNRSIPAEYIIPICEFFNISPEYLLTGKEPTPKATTIELPQPKLTENEEEMLSLLNQLSERDQIRLLGRVEGIVKEYGAKSNTEENVG